MRSVRRTAGDLILEACRNFPSLVITGPRRAGKTFLLRHLFPRASYLLLEDPDVRSRARSDPRALIEETRLPAIIDEIQNVPELFAYVRTQIDRNPRRMGQWM